MSASVPPRLHCVPAARAPVVAVLRRGPTDWSQVGRWDLAAGRYEPGAWLRARIFPRRSDLSPDGRFLCCFVHQPSATWEHGETYVAVSKLPWMTALHASGTDGTWTRGHHFVEGGELREGDRELPAPFRLRPTPAVQFASERRRGWEECADSPPRVPGDLWDERRNVRLRRQQPGGDRVLCVESLGVAGGEFGVDQAVDGLRVLYSVERGGEVRLLDDVQWADWHGDGTLLVATRSGRLQRRRPEADGDTLLFDEDLAGLQPRPMPAPAWAQDW